jgi:hypothetical protein
MSEWREFIGAGQPQLVRVQRRGYGMDKSGSDFSIPRQDKWFLSPLKLSRQTLWHTRPPI